MTPKDGLTREQVLVMQPGRELDALVAEYVFEWRRITGPKFDYYGPCEYGDVLIPPTMTEDEAFRMMSPKGMIPFGYFVNRKWSTDISAAWEVQEKLQDYGGMVLGCYGSKNGARWFSVQTVVNGKEISVTSHTAPEAICKAALLAVLDS